MNLYTSALRLSTFRHNILLLGTSTHALPSTSRPQIITFEQYDQPIPHINRQITNAVHPKTIGRHTINHRPQPSTTLPPQLLPFNCHPQPLPHHPESRHPYHSTDVPPPPHPPFPLHQTPHPPILTNKRLPTTPPPYPALNTIHLSPKINTTLHFQSLFNMAITYKMHGFNRGKYQCTGSNMGTSHHKKPMAANPRDESPEFSQEDV